MKNTKEKYVNVCFPSHFRVCTFLENFNFLKNSNGKIHFALTETATKWNGYMNGDLESNKRVISEILNLNNK